MIIGIIGAAEWGIGLAHMVARGGNNVILWYFDGDFAYFDGLHLPRNVVLTREMQDLQRCELWVVVTPAAFFRATMINASKFHKNQPIIVCAKGAEPQTGKFMTEVLSETVKPAKQNIDVLFRTAICR